MKVNCFIGLSYEFFLVQDILELLEIIHKDSIDAKLKLLVLLKDEVIEQIYHYIK